MTQAITLKKVASIEVFPTSLFNFDATIHKPDHFTSGDNLWEPGIRWQTWWWKGKTIGSKMENKGTIEKPKVNISLYAHEPLDAAFVDSIISEIKYRYNFDLDLNPFYDKFSNNDVLGPIIKTLYGMRPGQPSSLYEYLIIGIVLQNATVRRSINMFQTLLERYGTPLAYDGKKLWCFWEPGQFAKVSEEELRSLKVGYRAKYIKKVDDQFQNGMDEETLRKQDIEAQREQLLSIYGIGPATVWYILFDVFHHWDYFDHISPWEQKIYSKIFFNRDPEKPLAVRTLLRYIQRFSPYQHLAVHYIWEDLWWKRKRGEVPWLEKLIRV